MMPVDLSKKYKCWKCGEKAVEVTGTASQWKPDFSSYLNCAVGVCKSCGIPGEFATLNKTQFYKGYDAQTV